MIKQPQKILVMQLRRIGDVIFTLPVIGVLRRAFPDAKIDFLVEPPADELVRLNPYLNETLVYEKKDAWKWIGEIRKRKYDVLLDFLANGRSLFLTFLSGAKEKVGFKGPITRRVVYSTTVESSANQFIVQHKIDLLGGISALKNSSFSREWNWDLEIPQEAKLKAKTWLQQYQGKNEKKLIGFAPVHRHPVRAWLAERFAETARKLVERGFLVLFLSGPGEEESIQNIASKVARNALVYSAKNLLEISAMIHCCQILIANDNGLQKIALALGVPTLTIFGPTNPNSILPSDSRHLSVRDENLFCIGCELNCCPYQHECMKNVSVEMVLDNLEELIQRSQSKTDAGKTFSLLSC